MKLVKTPKMTSISKLKTTGLSIIEKMTAATGYFAAAAPLLATAQTALDHLVAASAAAERGSTADTQTMYLAATTFRTKLMILVLFVDVVALSDPATAADAIAAAGLEEKRRGSINIATISAKNGVAEGSVTVRSKSVRNRTYVFQQSDNNAVDAEWTTINTSTTATITVTDLTPMKKYWFRCALIKRAVQGEFCDPCSIVAL